MNYDFISNMDSFYYLKSHFKVDKDSFDELSIGIKIKISSNYIKIKMISKNKVINIPSEYLTKFDIKNTGDRYDNKICDRCFRFLPTEFFSNNRLKKGDVITKRPSCKDCRKEKDGKAISSEDRKHWDYKKPSKYSLFQCPICEKSSIVGISKIVLDHNHYNGKVRGYLCESCNTGIGRFDDDPSIIKNAIKWLK